MLHAFYARAGVTIEVAGGGEEEPKLTVTSRARAGLHSLEVEAPVSLGSAEWGAASRPGAVRVLAVYEDGHQFILPVAPTNDRLRSELIAFLPSLRADLEGVT